MTVIKGKKYELDNSKVKRELGIQFRPIDKAIVEAAKSLMDRKLVVRKEKGAKKAVVVSAVVLVAAAVAAYFAREKNLFGFFK